MQMGIVKRQGIKLSIVTYVGVLFGMVNILIIYPACLSPEELGILNFTRETAVMLSVFVFLGTSSLVVKFFPRFESVDKNHNGFLFFLFALLGFGILVMTVSWFILKDRILEEYLLKPNAELYIKFIPFILPFAILIAISSLLSYYISNFRRIVVPAIFNEFYYKIGIAILAVCYFHGLLSFDFLFWGLLIIYISILISLLIYLNDLGQLSLKPDSRLLKKPLLKEMGEFSLFGFLATFGSVFTTEFLSVFLVGTLTNLTSTGIFTIANFIANFIDVPRRAISGIANPLLSEQWQKNKLEDIHDLYKKSALNQLIAGIWMLLAIWISIDALFELMPKGELYQSGKYVILVLGFSKLINMGTGLSDEVVGYSPFYRYNLLFSISTSVVHTLGNYFLIKEFGIIGAAFASVISQTILNTLKFFTIKFKTGMQPFSWSNLYVILIAISSFTAVSLIPASGYALIDIILKSGLFSILFGGQILYFHISPDVNSVTWHILKRIHKFFNIQ
jgi:O-antigen/teichoic acid export membrane protein